MWRLSGLVRRELFEAFSKTNQYGLIFTYVWAFDLKQDWDFVERTCDIFASKGAEIYFVELEANVEERLKRNTTPFRLEQKPSKRNVAQSELDLKSTMQKYRLNSNEGEITQPNYMKIDNTHLSPEEVARAIKGRFQL
jgi:hypothetical protein